MQIIANIIDKPALTETFYSHRDAFQWMCKTSDGVLPRSEDAILHDIELSKDLKDAYTKASRNFVVFSNPFAIQTPGNDNKPLVIEVRPREIHICGLQGRRYSVRLLLKYDNDED